MENKFIISEEEKNRILDLHESATKNQYLISESITGQDMSSEDRMKKKYPNGYNIPYTVTSFGNSTFANGVDTINKNDPKIKEILTTISDLLKVTKGNVNVIVNGGASKVGSSSNYNNDALAARRRDNLINVINNNWKTNRLIVTKGSAKVGVSTAKDSAAATREQFVSASISGEKSRNIPIKAEKGDNTNVYIPDLNRNKIPGVIPKKNRKKKICITIPIEAYASFNRYFKKFASENGLSKIPWSEKDV